MMSNSNKIIKNFLWRFFERCGAQGVKLLVELVLARLLLPDDYGLIALVTVFITILNVFVDSGLGSALIQKKNTDNLDFSTVFWFNICLCVVLYSILFISSPFIAKFYGRPELSSVVRLLGIEVLISGVKNVEQAYVSKTMQFKKFFFSTLGGTIGAAIIGIIMAIKGYGVWALVAQHLFNSFMDTVVLWITVKWRPQMMFSISRLKSLLSFGWKLLISTLVDTIYNEIRQLVIGKKYSSSELAFYNRGRQIPYLFVYNVNSAIDSVLLPTLSNEQDNVNRVKEMTRRSIQISVYLMAPILIGLAFTGETIVRIVLTEKWLLSVPYIRIFCISFLFYPIHTANLNAIKALGRSDIYLKLEILKKIIGIIALVITMNISVMAMAYSLLVTSVIGQLLNSWPNRKLLNYRYLDQLKDILPSIGLAIVMGLIIGCFHTYNNILTLACQIVCGLTIYIIGSMILKLDPYVYLKKTILKIR